MKKRVLFWGWLAFVFMCIFSACGKEELVDEANVISLFYVGNSETKVVMREYVLQENAVEDRVREIIENLSTVPYKLEYKPPLAQGFTLLGYGLEENVLSLNVDAGYHNLTPVQEVLTRAALVRSFTQLGEVSYVTITVEGEPLYDSLGNTVGLMSADNFIDNAGREINTYEEVQLTLYFANENGDGLVAAHRTLHYNTNIPAEKLVVEQILAGVGEGEMGCFPTINPETKLLNVMVKDGICYVNFDKTFLTPVSGVMPMVTIYSLVNSLTELGDIHKVQILVEGETDVNYREVIVLTTFFERDLEMKK